ncbi:LppX_LprAFG lipoprotein [Janibacter sp. GS2]|uniref:LppX_LprAFG lipoprotein n=1 Tax=Janibacter sp. GS2 TaxID=3442646 RepID=UPI003EC07E62
MLRMTTTAAATAALTLALTACGGGGGPGPTAGDGFDNSSTPAAPSTSDGEPNSTPPPSASPTATSSQDSTDEGTSATTADADPSATDGTSSTSTNTGTPFDPDEFTDTLEKAVDANPTVHIDVTVTAGGQESATASGRQDLANDSLDMQVKTDGQQLGYRLVNGQYYLAQPPKWVPVTEDSTNPLVKQALEQVQLLSMRTQFDAFVAGVEKAGDKGTEKIDGVTTRHYTATVNTDKAYEQLGTDKDPNAPDSLIYDVWLDEDDLIRQMTFTQDGSTATLVAKDWGEPVDITKPKDSEIAGTS